MSAGGTSLPAVPGSAGSSEYDQSPGTKTPNERWRGLVKTVNFVIQVLRPHETARRDIYIVTRSPAELRPWPWVLLGESEEAVLRPLEEAIRAGQAPSITELAAAGVKHWSLFLVSDNWRWTLFEMVKCGSTMEPRRLRDDKAPGRISGKCRFYHVGQTTLDDDYIMKLAQAIPLRKGEIYHLFRNNCQTFCRFLYLCIRIPYSSNMVFESLHAIPDKFFDGVVRRQLREFEAISLYSWGKALITPQVREALPMSVEMLLSVLSRLALVACVIFVLMGFSKLLVLLVMFIAVRYARLNVWRVLSKYLTTPPEDLCCILHFGDGKLDLRTELMRIPLGPLGILFYPPTSTIPLFDPQYDFVPRSKLAVSFERFCLFRQIEDVPVGFDCEDVKMASMTTLPDPVELEKFLALTDDSLQKEYQIGLAFLATTGHAEVVLRHGNLSAGHERTNLDLTSQPPIISSRNLLVLEDGELKKAKDIELRILHLRYTNGDSSSLELALEKTPSGNVQYCRYVDLYRIRTTERQLRQIALRSCPSLHCILLDDCATFAYNFLTGVLDHLESRGLLSKTQKSSQRQLLLWENHVINGVVGQSEVTSRISSTVASEIQHPLASATPGT